MTQAHSNAWYDELASKNGRYEYAWNSKLSLLNGEALFSDLVKTQLASDKTVLDVGCGHGEDALFYARHARSVTAYDRAKGFIETARETARAQGVQNIEFILSDSSARANNGAPRIPTDQRFDLLVTRRGPTHWLADARRAAKTGAVLIGLHPAEVEPPVWANDLPAGLIFPIANKGSIKNRVEARLAESDLQFESTWHVTVPELLLNAQALYDFLSFGLVADMPSYSEVELDLEALFSVHARAGKLAIPQARFLWQARVL